MNSDNIDKPPAERPYTLASLRDRTDELELIISSLTIFALVSLPGVLFESFSQSYTHLSASLAAAGIIGISLATGVSYGLAACFIVHLMARAYWVGLIGLRTVFPNGIDWSKTPGIGPLTRKRYREHIPDLDTVIQSSDRLASSLFAVISLLTLGMLWLGTLVMLTVIAATQVGAHFGLTNTAISIASLALLSALAGIPALLWVLDAQLARRLPSLQTNRSYVGIIAFLGRLSGLVYPQRLVLPVQLTLQSNTRPLVFYLVLTMSVATIVALGNTRMVAWRSFTLSGEFTYLDSSDAEGGFRSTYYEDMQSPEDRLRGWPRIDSFSQKGSFIRVFLPYQPLRDNLMLDQLCSKDRGSEDAVICLRKLWAVQVNDVPVSMVAFETAERMDIHMRGLIGLVPTTDLSPGMHRINVTWNPNAAIDEKLLDDRYSQVKRSYSIPMAFTPDYERAL